MVNAKGKIMSVILLIVALIVVFQIIGSTSNDLQGAGNAITDANNCSEDTQTDSTGARFTYSQSTKNCINSSGADQYLAGQYDLPLNNLFAANGVVFLIFMAGVLLMIIIISLKTIKKK